MTGSDERRRGREVCTAWLLLAAASGAQESSAPPSAPRGEAVFEMHETLVPDPYRHLETDSPEREAWARAHDAVTERTFEGDVLVEALRERMIELNDYERARVPRRAGDHSFLWGRIPGRLVSDIRIRSGDEPERVLVDPDAHPASPGSTLGVGDPVPSPDGTFVLYGASSSTLPTCVRVLEVETGADLADDAVPVTFWPWRVCWLADGVRFAYVLGDEVRVHEIGTPTSEDPMLFRWDEPRAAHLAVRASAEDSTLFVTAFDTADDTTRVFLRDVDHDDDWDELFEDFDAAFQVLGKRRDEIFVYTTLDAPNGFVVAVDPRKPDRQQWRTVVPEYLEPIYDDNHPMRPTVGLFGQRIAVLFGIEGRLVLRVHDLVGKLSREVVHEELGFTESGLVGTPDRAVVRYDVQSLLDPGTAYEVDLMTGERRVLARSRVPFEAGDFVFRREDYESHDGVEVPIFLAHRADVEARGENPVLIINWSALGMVVRPLFLPELHSWMEAGGVLAFPAVRGSGEYGESWTRAGSGRNKLAAIDDVGAAARWLVETGVAPADGVGLVGASSAGPATASALVRHPDAFGAGLVQIPRVDLLADPAWPADYGDPNDPDDFAAMLEWLPLANAAPREYPPILVQVGSVDTVAPPFHGYKLYAALRAAQRGPAPIRLQVVWGIGHNQGKGIPHRSETLARQFAFLAHALGLDSRL